MLCDGSLPEGGTLIATDDVPCMQVLTTALPDGSLPEGGTLIATDELPCMQVLTTARSPTRYADTVYKNEYGWKVGPEYMHAKPADGMTSLIAC